MNRSEELPLLSAFEMSASSFGHHASQMHESGNSVDYLLPGATSGRYSSVTSSADTLPINNVRGLKRGRVPDSIEEEQNADQQEHHGTMRQTIVNIAKACAGTGTLALPYAASQGGYLFNMLGLLLMSYWNVYSVETLCKCRNLIPAAQPSASVDGANNVVDPQTPTSKGQRHKRTRSNMRKMFRVLTNHRVDIDKHDAEVQANQIDGIIEDPPPEGTATYGRVAWYAFGPIGLHIIDIMMIVLLCGITIAYQDALISFIGATPFGTGSPAFDSLWTVLIIAPLSCVPDLSYLSKCSALGIFAICTTFGVISCYGIMENGLSGLSIISWEDMWPKSLTGACIWFGIIAFGYGVTPIAYNIQESMQNPDKMPSATKHALLAVCGAYVIISNGVAILFKPTVEEFQGDILQELPESWLPTSVRLAMALVVLVTIPLLVSPSSEIIEGKLGMDSNSSLTLRFSIRFVICLLCSAAASFIPGFVHIISFIGAFCMSLTSFVFPPIMHINLVKRSYQEKIASKGSELFLSSCELERFGNSKEEREKELRSMRIDTVLLVCGIVVTIFASSLTLSDAIRYSKV